MEASGLHSVTLVAAVFFVFLVFSFLPLSGRVSEKRYFNGLDIVIFLNQTYSNSQKIIFNRIYNISVNKKISDFDELLKGLCS